MTPSPEQTQPNLPIEKELEKAIVSYRMECDLYWSDREQGVYTQEEYDDSVNYALNKAMQLIRHYATKRELEAFQHGVKVGQYQAADKLYGDVCHIYMFGDNKDSAKARSISEWSAVGLLKDCEAFMNDNRKAYKEYLTQLKAQKEQELK